MRRASSGSGQYSVESILTAGLCGAMRSHRRRTEPSDWKYAKHYLILCDNCFTRSAWYTSSRMRVISFDATLSCSRPQNPWRAIAFSPGGAGQHPLGNAPTAVNGDRSLGEIILQIQPAGHEMRGNISASEGTNDVSDNHQINKSSPR